MGDEVGDIAERGLAAGRYVGSVTLPPPLHIRRARIVGGTDAPVDVLLERGLITHIGARVPAAGHEIDLDGRYLVPGLWDHHVHFTLGARMRGRLDVSGARSAREAAVLVAARAASEAGFAEPLLGVGFRGASWLDEPTAELLDEAAAGRPVALFASDLHSVWLSTSAAPMFGAPRPGLLWEHDAFAVELAVEKATSADEDGLVADAVAHAAARGVVGIVDMEMADTTSQWARRAAKGIGPMRVSAACYPYLLDETIARGHHTGDAVEGTDAMVRVGPLKVISDGSLGSRTAACYEPYAGTTGVLNVGPSELGDLMARATDNGLACAIHAIGDRANANALDAFAATGARGSIEHAQLIATRDIARFAELRIVASVQPEHALDDISVTDSLWADRKERAFMLASLLDAGIELHLGSDFPVAQLDPWAAIASAVFRTRGARAPWNPRECLTVHQALAASVHSRISVGSVADIVAIEADPLTADVATLRTMPVALTVVAGRVAYLGL